MVNRVYIRTYGTARFKLDACVHLQFYRVLRGSLCAWIVYSHTWFNEQCARKYRSHIKNIPVNIYNYAQ